MLAVERRGAGALGLGLAEDGVALRAQPAAPFGVGQAEAEAGGLGVGARGPTGQKTAKPPTAVAAPRPSNVRRSICMARAMARLP